MPKHWFLAWARSNRTGLDSQSQGFGVGLMHGSFCT